MKQLTQKLKDGTMEVLEMPGPVCGSGMLLVKNHYSLVSAGTEGKTVKVARTNLIGKATELPQQAKQVKDTLKSEGPIQTYRTVKKKLDAHSPLGYSCAGEVIEIAPDVNEFQAGDLVACGGLTASHAEIVAVPKNLSVRLEPDADLKQAAYNTLGAFAMQAVRQVDLRLGETCAVIGLGLLGQLAALLLRTTGIRLVGIDIDQAMVDLASEHCANLAVSRSTPGIEHRIKDFTGGLGCDGVIIAAATDSLDPINFAGAISRKRGTIVVLGAVPTGFDREPHFYQKELEVKMSCSSGPGRYDPSYEEKGIDYPAAYVRWTEKRNMQAFQDLILRKKIDLSYLTTHTFKLAEAPTAYDMILKRSESFLGILIEYDATKQFERTQERLQLKSEASKRSPCRVSVGFIGAGSYAQGYLLPNVPRHRDVALKGVMTMTSTTARSAGERFGFEFCTSNEAEILQNQEINTVFIATRHDSHAEYVIKALAEGHHVFVEKPLCLTQEELDEVKQSYERSLASLASPPILMVGYNRRFSPLAQMMRESVASGPMAMIYRVNAGAIPRETWIQDTEIGGGRIIGEVCHFVDFLTFISGSAPDSVYATVMNAAAHLNDTLNVSLTYPNGSIGTISYFANGNRRLPKERVEVYAHGISGVLDDFKTITVYGNGQPRTKRLFSRNKGQKNQILSFLDAIRTGSSSPIPFPEIYDASLVTFKILESIRTGQSIRL